MSDRLPQSHPFSPHPSSPYHYPTLSTSRSSSRIISPSPTYTSRPQTPNLHIQPHNNKNAKTVPFFSSLKWLLNFLMCVYLILVIVRNSEQCLWLLKHPLYFIMSPLNSSYTDIPACNTLFPNSKLTLLQTVPFCSNDSLSLNGNILTNPDNQPLRISCPQRFCGV